MGNHKFDISALQQCKPSDQCMQEVQHLQFQSSRQMNKSKCSKIGFQQRRQLESDSASNKSSVRNEETLFPCANKSLGDGFFLMGKCQMQTNAWLLNRWSILSNQAIIACTVSSVYPDKRIQALQSIHKMSPQKNVTRCNSSRAVIFFQYSCSEDCCSVSSIISEVFFEFAAQHLISHKSHWSSNSMENKIHHLTDSLEITPDVSAFATLCDKVSTKNVDQTTQRQSDMVHSLIMSQKNCNSDRMYITLWSLLSKIMLIRQLKQCGGICTTLWSVLHHSQWLCMSLYHFVISSK